MYRGSSVASVVYLEVTPLVLPESNEQKQQQASGIHLTNFSVKHYLQECTQSCAWQDASDVAVRVVWDDKENDKRHRTLASGFLVTAGDDHLQWIYAQKKEEEEDERAPIMFLPSDDPCQQEPHPCAVRIFCLASACTAEVVHVSPSTLVCILPPKVARLESSSTQLSTPPLWFSAQEIKYSLLGESSFNLSSELEAQVCCNHNPETLKELTLRFSLLLSQPIQIGTTVAAIDMQRERLSRRARMRRAILHSETLASSQPSPQQSSGETSFSAPIPWEPSLLVHSPNHAEGKTLLCQIVAHRVGCRKEHIHLLRPSALFAKFGSHADAALDCLVHSWILRAAVRDEPVSIIFDALEAFLPARLSNQTSAGDAAAPVLQAIASYLRRLTASLQRRHEIPFPSKHVLYQTGNDTSSGHVLSARVCLLGIVTCPDDGWRAASIKNEGGTTGSSIFTTLVGGRYRVPSLLARTRFEAFSTALEVAGVELDDSAKLRLPALAASAAWAKGSSYGRVAAKLKELLCCNEGRTCDLRKVKATTKDLELALTLVKKDCGPAFADVSFQSGVSGDNSEADNNDTLFGSVGGNITAKRSLEDALALDPKKRKMLAQFGLTPPSGILLYGPPGCGKTMLAKAVAKLLRAPSQPGDSSVMPLGGTFISLSSSDIVRAEIGTSEKILTSAFEFADKNAPSVIFLDEFQALFTERSRGGSGKLATTLLQCMDDIKRWQRIDIGNDSERRVVVLGATNTPWMVDSAFLRSGRFDRVVHVGLPDAKERQSILLTHVRNMRIRRRNEQGMLVSLCRKLAQQTAGFSGADLAALCRSAAIRTIVDVGSKGEVDELQFWEALKHDVRASSDDALVRRLMSWKP